MRPSDAWGDAQIIGEPVEWSREDSWLRDKEYLGLRNPQADQNGYERWPRLCAEVPTELVRELEEAQRVSLGVNWDGYMKRPRSATHANLVRAGLRLYLERFKPEPEIVEGTCVEIVDRPLLKT